MKGDKCWLFNKMPELINVKATTGGGNIEYVVLLAYITSVMSSIFTLVSENRVGLLTYNQGDHLQRVITVK